MSDARPIGVFDSGVGGLTVVRELLRQLPDEDIVYFGDTARVPYGIKSKDTVIKFTFENIFFLLKFDVKQIVIACNTASSLALPTIKRQFKTPLIGVIAPGAKEAVYATKNKKVGVIGTRATINSGAYKQYIKKFAPSVKVYSLSCPLFVPLAEEGYLDSNITYQVALEYLGPLKKLNVDTIILGCTHYPLLKPVIRKVVGKKVVLIDSAKQVVAEVKEILKEEGLESNKQRKGQVKFFVSDETEFFTRVGRRFLGNYLKDVKKVDNV
ncbi:MAG: glutamate racemase [Candidatus Omnitrophota bacterium]